jgi:hypothetical protein
MGMTGRERQVRAPKKKQATVKCKTKKNVLLEKGVNFYAEG